MQIDLPILESVKDYQAQHGLKYENYRRYRSYCSRRLHRLRRSLNVRQGVQSSAKARHQRAKKLIDITNAMVLEAAEKELEYGERMLIIPLCLAERAWAYAMQLKQETGEQPRKRFHLVRRLKKASKHAQNFEKLCHDQESPCTERTKQESVAYAAYVTGLYRLERENWKEAKENLHKALSLYYTLSVSIRKEDILEHYRQRIDELKASLRYCAFNLGDQAAKESKVKLPNTLQFHDLAFRHAQKLFQEQEDAKLKAVTSIEQKMVIDDVNQETERKVVADKSIAKQPLIDAKHPTEEEDEDDEFEETQEALADESEQDSDEDSDDDEDDKQQQSGGVTGLVKGWLGGAWSRG